MHFIISGTLVSVDISRRYSPLLRTVVVVVVGNGVCGNFGLVAELFGEM